MENILYISDVILKYIPGNWGEESNSTGDLIKVACIRGADINDLNAGQFDKLPIRYIAKSSLNKNSLQEGCIVIEKSGGSPTQSTGRVAYVSRESLENRENIVCSNFCAAFSIKPEWDSRYIFYYLQYFYNKGVFFYFEGKTSGLHNLQVEQAFKAIPIKKTPLPEQKRIASVLSSLDRKIALNRQINQNLEALARQLYDYWFVQFDFPDANGKPYKSSGGKMVYNPILKREIPEGWEMKKLGELCYFSNGINYDKTIEGDTNYKIVNVRNISSSSMLIDSEDLDSICLPSKQAKNYLIEKNAILIARSGVPGATRIVEDVLDCIYCGFIIKCLPHNQLLRLYLTFLLKQFEGTTLTQTGGSILKNVSQETLKSICIVVPLEEILKTFDTQIQTIIDTMNLQINQIASLTKQRDELLPLLMNGQVNFDLSDD